MTQGHTTVVYDKDPKAVAALAAGQMPRAPRAGGFSSSSWKRRAPLGDAAAGKITEATIEALSKLMAARRCHHRRRQHLLAGDVRRGKASRSAGCICRCPATSGGIWGIERVLP